jgi:hypothetical protein
MKLDIFIAVDNQGNVGLGQSADDALELLHFMDNDSKQIVERVYSFSVDIEVPTTDVTEIKATANNF